MKKILAVCLCAAMVLSMGGFGKKKKTLVLSTFGLSNDISVEEVYGPFEKQFNCEIVPELGTTSERYTKISSDPNSPVDVIELSQATTYEGVAAGVFEKIDTSKLSNYEYLIDAAKNLADNGGGIAYTLNSIGIIYDPSCGVEINSFADLWNPALKGMVSIPEITTTFGPSVVYLASEYKGVDPTTDNGAAAFEALAELKPNLVKTYAKSADLVNMFAAGEVKAAIVGDFGVPTIQAANPQTVFVVPEGTYCNFNVISINANSKNKELAYEYLNYRISKDLQSKTAVVLNEGPTNKTVELTPEQAAKLTYGEVAAKAKAVDYSFYTGVKADWIDQWNRIINS